MRRRRVHQSVGFVVVGVGGLAGVTAAVLAPRSALSAADQAWPAFVLVLGLLLLGFAAAEDGAFAAAARLLARVPGGRWPGYLVAMALVASTSVLLNLDTAVAFLTPVVVLLAREHAADERPFLYGCVLVSNSASLLLPGSNLTNLIVLQHPHRSGLDLAARIWPAWLVAVVVTAMVPPLVFHRVGDAAAAPPAPVARPAPGVSLAGVALAALAMLVLTNPALPVLGLGALTVLAVTARGRTSLGRLVATIDVTTLAGLFGLALATGTVARSWEAPSRWLAGAGRWSTALLATGAAVALNNLPAAMLLSAAPAVHPRAMLLGLNIGPNIAVTGSLSAVLWLQAARPVAARTSVRCYTLVGSIATVIAIPAALLVTR
ncbi:MAG TPA: SLC13 family permease [Mycobacteriales bacterium]|nr:SLC13 family permease [Mycobacteriales bacterium]